MLRKCGQGDHKLFTLHWFTPLYREMVRKLEKRCLKLQKKTRSACGIEGGGLIEEKVAERSRRVTQGLSDRMDRVGDSIWGRSLGSLVQTSKDCVTQSNVSEVESKQPLL